jgi:hypothetical protein
MKHLLKRAVAFLGLAAALAALALGTASQAARAQDPAPRTVTVTGIGTASVTPDLAYLRVGVDVTNTELAVALSETTTRVEAMFAALRALGVAEADIRTEQYTIFREERFDPATNATIPVFRVINVARVTVRDVTRVVEVLNGAVAAGANTVQNVEFGTADVRPTESTARRLAFVDAGARAAELAGLAGAVLGEVISVREEISFGASGQFERGSSGGGGAVSPGVLEVSVNLTVTYSLR